MAKRNSLTDREVSLIKSLLSRKTYKNQEIAGLINRSRGDASSDVNSGRITDIKNNKTQRYKLTAPASDFNTDKFLKEFEETNTDPVSDRNLNRLFPIKSKSPLILSITETDQVECKKSFDAHIKTIAAFANNKGGYFLFGVENKTWRVEGLADKKFENFDWSKLNQSVRSALGIGLELTPRVFDLEGKKIGILYIAPAHTKPVIFIKGDGSTAEGHIYYRYAGEDRLISPVDLQKIINDRIRKDSETVLMKHISTMLRFGIENSAVMNTATGEVSGKGGNFLIDEAIIPKLSFIREGQFVEKDGTPTLRLVGNIQPINNLTVKKGVIALTDDKHLEDFVRQRDVEDPQEYIKYLPNTQRLWLPIHYYIQKSNLDNKSAITIIASAGGKKARTADHIKRLNGTKSPTASGNKQSYKKEMDEIKSKSDFSAKNKQQISKYFWAILHMSKGEIEKEYGLCLLQQNYERLYIRGNDSEKSLFCTAASKLDEIFFKSS